MLESLFSKGYKHLIRNLKKLYHIFDRNVIFSIGENCLTDNILERNNLKSFSSPYSSGRSNIEYILSFEKDMMADFINPSYLKYEYFDEKKVVRNKKYVETINYYDKSVTNGFEFTHHDIIKKEKLRVKIKKRCERIQQLKNKNIIMVYHHRLCYDTDKKLLAEHLQEYIDIYKTRKNKVKIFAFTQSIVTDVRLRHLEKEQVGDIFFYTLYTLNKWEGDNQDIFWAYCDNDLINEMVKDIHNVMI